MEHYLTCDFNLLVYGVGSKLAILTKFAEQYLVQNYEFFDAAHAYNRAFCMKDLLKSLKDFIFVVRKRLDNLQKNAPLQDTFEYVRHCFDEEAMKERLTVVIHSLDMGQLKQKEMMELLC